jgi:hypothetical protein
MLVFMINKNTALKWLTAIVLSLSTLLDASATGRECNDHKDNDGDGLIDYGTTECPEPGKNLLVNGSFESPVVTGLNYARYSSIPGWVTTKSNQIFEIQRGVQPAQSGSQNLELDNQPHGVMQTLPGYPKAEFIISLYYSPRPGYGKNQAMEVEWNGARVGKIEASGDALSWKRYEFRVQSNRNDKPNELALKSIRTHNRPNDAGGNLVDNVSVELVAGSCIGYDPDCDSPTDDSEKGSSSSLDRPLCKAVYTEFMAGTPTFQWTAVTGATSYEFAIWKGDQVVYSNPNVTGSVSNGLVSFTLPASASLPASNNYWYRVKAKKGSTQSLWCLDPSMQDKATNFPVKECQDDRDNDGDQLIDLKDPDCSCLTDGSESGPAATATPTSTPTRTATATPTRTYTYTATPTRTATPTPTATCSTAPTKTPTVTPTPTPTPTATCSTAPTKTPTVTPTPTGTPRPQCSDGIDNDHDGVTDKEDPGCWKDPTDPNTYDPNRNDESAATTQCQDGKDNDGDTKIDSKDPGCWTDPSNPATYDRTR